MHSTDLTDLLEKSDEYFMRLALREAHKAFDADEVPIGAIVVVNNHIVAKGYNQVELLKDSTSSSVSGLVPLIAGTSVGDGMKSIIASKRGCTPLLR